jgi:putative sterol carrier protein
MVAYWVDRTEKLMAFEELHTKQCFRITYESLVLNPVQTLEPMFSFLGVEWDDELPGRIFSEPHEDGRGDAKIIFSNKVDPKAVGKGATIPRHRIPQELSQRMNCLLIKLDYPTATTEWEETGSELVRQADIYGSVKEVFTHFIPQMLNSLGDVSRDSGTTYKIIVTGEEGSAWIVGLSEREVCSSSPDAAADCTIVVSSADLLDIVNGRLNPATAFLEGKLSVLNRLDLARRFGGMLFQYRER